MRVYFYLIFSVVMANHVFGQQTNFGQIEGKVQDSALGVLENVNVLILKTRDSSLVKAGISDKSGLFLLKGIKPGTYLLSVSKTGYLNNYSRITVSETKLVLPAITLSYAVKNLGAVTVTGKKPLIEHTDEKISYNVENDPLAVSENAIDLLRKTPLVTVDGQGNIEVNGQNNFKVLLNGRETSMFARNVSDALKGFPGSLIKKIEVITNPSAKYDGEGVGGLINIITKKKVAGYNGTLNLSAGSIGFVNVNTSLNIKYGKFGVSGYVGFGGNYGQKNKVSEEIESKNTLAFYKRITNGNDTVTNRFNYGNIELSYEVDSFHVLSAYISPGGGGNSHAGTSLFNLILPNKTDTVRSIYTSSDNNNDPSFNTGLDYIQKFKSNADKEFSIKLNGDFSKDNRYATGGQYNPGSSRYIINDNKGFNNQYTVQTDYILPLTKVTKFEFGAKAIFRKASSDYQSLVKYNVLDSYKTNPGNTDYFTYTQDVYSLYGTYAWKIGKINIRSGLRVEQTDLNGNFISTATSVSQHYWNLLPNLLVSTKFKKGQTLSLSYGKRLGRPGIWVLNPFVNNSDSLNITKGNPALQPQLFHSYALQYRFSAGQTFISFGLTNSFSNNRILQYISFNDQTGVSTSISANIGKNNQTSFNMSVNGKFSSKWSYSTNGRIAYENIENTTGMGVLKNSGFSGNGFVNTNYTFHPKFAFSAFMGYIKFPPLLQGKSGENLYYGVGFNYKLFHDKLTMNLLLQNFHADYYTYASEYEDSNFRRSSKSAGQYRAFRIGASWRFGKLKENVSKKRGVVNDDLLGK